MYRYLPLKQAALILFLFAGASPACAGPNSVTLENRTWTPMHYRVRASDGPYSDWRAVLPGETCSYGDHAELVIELWIDKDRSQTYSLRRGDIYSFKRKGPESAPALVWVDAAGEALPGVSAPASAARPFAPLEEFITRCKKQNLTYRLSLKQFAAECAAAQKNGPLPQDLRFLHGFTWFAGYLVDEADNDVVLLGLRDPARPPIDVDCLATAIKSAYSDSVPSCSLDDHPDPAFQKSVVSGVPWNTRWAEVMILADYDMKRLCQGQWDPGIPGFKSQIRHFQDVLLASGFEGEGGQSKSEKGGRNYLNRWWFNFNSRTPRAVCDEDGKLVYLYKNPVRVSTEQNLNGAYGSGTTTESSRRFADGFTEHMDALGKHYPRIAELQAIYRLYDLMRHLREVSQTTPPGMRYWVEQYAHPYKGPPAAMPTLRREYVVNVRTGGGYETQNWNVNGGVEMRLGIDRRTLERGTRPAEFRP